MYSTKPRTSTVYHKTENSLDAMDFPLKALAMDHINIVNKYKALQDGEKAEYRDYLVIKRTKEYNATHEDSLEEEMDVEDEVNAKFPAEQVLGKAGSEEVDTLLEEFAKKYGIPAIAHWFFPQMLAKFAKCTLQKDETGKYSGKLLHDNYLIRDQMLYALLIIATYPKRSVFMKSQTDPALRDYCGLVPLILAAFKKYHDIPYSAWSVSGLTYVVDVNLAKAMSVEELPDITVEEVLEDRRSGLMVKTGAKAGELRNPATTYTLYLSSQSVMYKLPTLAKIMMCQTWCAHPTNRTKYMVLNPVKWDDMPEALVVGEVFEKKEAYEAPKKFKWGTKTEVVPGIIPWNT